MPSKQPPAPRVGSVGECTFALHCRAEKLIPIEEYVFHPKRKWRLDFFFPEFGGIAVEIEGGYGGRHQRMGGFTEDAYKYNAAAKMGIRVMRYTTQMVMNGDAINDVLEIMGRTPAM